MLYIVALTVYLKHNIFTSNNVFFFSGGIFSWSQNIQEVFFPGGIFLGGMFSRRHFFQEAFFRAPGNSTHATFGRSNFSIIYPHLPNSRVKGSAIEFICLSVSVATFLHIGLKYKSDGFHIFTESVVHLPL